MNLRKYLKLYVISSEKYGEEVKTLSMALEGGATAVQLRMKNSPDKIFYEKAKELRKITEEYDALFIVNDRIDIAIASNADGVHLGSDDLPVEIAREIAPNLIIGRTVRDKIMAKKLEKYVDYFGAGSVFPSKTKSAKVIGLAGLKEIVESFTIPVVAVGGIDEENILKVLNTGAAGVAISSAILGAENIVEKTKRIRNILEDFFSPPSRQGT